MNLEWELDLESGFMFLCRKITRPVNLNAELERVIEQEFQQSASPYKLQLQIVNDLRNESLCEDKEIQIEDVIKLKKYAIMLQQISQLVPDDTIEFEWDDVKFRSLDLEHRYVLYQLASFYSLLAVLEESYDKAGIYFQYCAGILEKLNCSYELMLAQAQEMYYLKCVKNGFKDSILVKLCHQIWHLYKVHDGSDYYTLKRIYYICLTYYHYSKACRSNNKLHDEKAYICEIIKLLDTVNNDEPKYFKALQDLENLKLKTLTILDSLDDDLIVGEIKELPFAQLVKCLIPKDLLNVENHDGELFEGLLSLDKVNEIREYQAQMLSFIENELILPIGKLEEFLKNECSLIDIDGKIQKLLTPNVPQKLENYRDQLLSLGSHEKLQSLDNELKRYKDECRKELDFVWSLKLPQNGRSETTIKSFHIYEQYMKQSVNGDELISTQITELTPFLQVFDDYQTLKEYLPDKEYLLLNNGLEAIVKEHNMLKGKLGLLEKEELKFLNEVKEKYEKINFINSYKKKQNESIEKIFKDEILKFGKEIEKVESFQEKQDELLAIYRHLNVRFMTECKDLKCNYKFNETVEVLKSTYDGFQETYKNLNQGLEFYKNLLENILVKKNIIVNI